MISEVGFGAKVLPQFCAVPKGNFPAGLPSELADSLVAPEDFENMELVGGGRADRNTHHVIRQEVQRQRLGKQRCDS